MNRYTSLIASIAGIALLSSNINPKYKLFAPVFAVPGTLYSIGNWQIYRKRKSTLDELQVEVKRLMKSRDRLEEQQRFVEKNLSDRETAMATKELSIEESLEDLKRRRSQIVEDANHQAERIIQGAIALSQQEKLAADQEIMRLEKAEAASHKRRQQSIEKAIRKVAAIANKIRDERDDLNQAKKRAEIAFEEFRKAENEMRDRWYAIEFKKAKEDGIASAQDAINQLQAELEADYDKSVENLATEHEKKLEALDKQINASISAKEELQKAFTSEVDACVRKQLSPLLMDLDRFKKEAERWKAEAVEFQNELAAIARPHRPPFYHGNRAYELGVALLDWYEKRGIRLNWVNSTLSPNGTCQVYFHPFNEKDSGDRLVAKITAQFSSVVSDFNCLTAPLFELGHQGNWVITFQPKEEYRKAMNAMLNLPSVEEGVLEAQEITPAVATAVGDNIDARREYEFMLNYRPPSSPVPKPYPRDPSQDELTRFSWYMKWRAIATNGKEDNITSAGRLMKLIYGVGGGGSASRVHPLMGMSIRQRTQYIIKQLGGNPDEE